MTEGRFLRTSLSGLGVVPGIAAGRVVTLRDSRDLADVPTGAVLVLRESWPGAAVALLYAKGVIVEFAGRVSHIGMIAAELGRPCVVGVEGAGEVLADGMWVSMDGSTGQVVVDHER